MMIYGMSNGVDLAKKINVEYHFRWNGKRFCFINHCLTKRLHLILILNVQINAWPSNISVCIECGLNDYFFGSNVYLPAHRAPLILFLLLLLFLSTYAFLVVFFVNLCNTFSLSLFLSYLNRSLRLLFLFFSLIFLSQVTRNRNAHYIEWKTAPKEWIQNHPMFSFSSISELDAMLGCIINITVFSWVSIEKFLQSKDRKTWTT